MVEQVPSLGEGPAAVLMHALEHPAHPKVEREPCLLVVSVRLHVANLEVIVGGDEAELLLDVLLLLGEVFRRKLSVFNASAVPIRGVPSLKRVRVGHRDHAVSRIGLKARAEDQVFESLDGLIVDSFLRREQTMISISQ